MQITFTDVSADYVVGPIRNENVLHSINLTIKPGTITAIIGHTGAGKTSLLRCMNGLLLPKTGQIQVGKYQITPHIDQRQTLNKIRQHVGMVFQFPESQLFAETVEKDICFGPLNFGVSLTEAQKRAKQTLQLVGLNQDILQQSPFSLSGGQKRRVAIAGVLATNPKVLILDEPGAGLDPDGKQTIYTLLTRLNREAGMTIILVTHDMNDVAQYADEAIVMQNGQVVSQTGVRELFSLNKQLEDWHLDLPDALRFQKRIERETGVNLPYPCLTVDELADALIKAGLV